jgi:hypothetical protein
LEFNQHSIACGFDDAALALRNCRIDQLQPDCLKPGEGAGLVGFHEAAIADDIRCQNRCKPAFNTLVLHLWGSGPSRCKPEIKHHRAEDQGCAMSHPA